MRKLIVTLPDELQAFVECYCGPGKPYTTPDELIQHLLREHKDRLEAKKIAEAILEGCRDVLEGRTVEYRGNLRSLLDDFNKTSR